MKTKRLLVPDRARQLPAHWSWIDHRLVRDDHMSRCSQAGWTLYLFLVTVGDAQGLSFYSDPGVARRLGWSPQQLSQARRELLQADLVAYQKPLYQVLDLSPSVPGTASARAGENEGQSPACSSMQGGREIQTVLTPHRYRHARYL